MKRRNFFKLAAVLAVAPIPSLTAQPAGIPLHVTVWVNERLGRKWTHRSRTVEGSVGFAALMLGRGPSDWRWVEDRQEFGQLPEKVKAVITMEDTTPMCWLEKLEGPQ